MELFIFARFHALVGQDAAVAAALREQVPAVRAQPGMSDDCGLSFRPRFAAVLDLLGAGSMKRPSRSMPNCRIPSASWSVCNS